MSLATLWSWALIFFPSLWVARLWATSVIARIAAISGFRCVPTPMVSNSGSFVTVSSAAAPMVVTPVSHVRFFRWTSTPLSANFARSCPGTESGSTSTSGTGVFLYSAMDQASLSMSSKVACRTASSIVFPAAMPLVWNLYSWRSVSGL